MLFKCLFKCLCIDSLTSFHILLQMTGLTSCKEWKFAYDYLRDSGLISLSPLFINCTILSSFSLIQDLNKSSVIVHLDKTNEINLWLYILKFTFLLVDASINPFSYLVLVFFESKFCRHESAHSFIVLFVDSSGFIRHASLFSKYMETISVNSAFGETISYILVMAEIASLLNFGFESLQAFPSGISNYLFQVGIYCWICF